MRGPTLMASTTPMSPEARGDRGYSSLTYMSASTRPRNAQSDARRRERRSPLSSVVPRGSSWPKAVQPARASCSTIRGLAGLCPGEARRPGIIRDLVCPIGQAEFARVTQTGEVYLCSYAMRLASGAVACR